MGQPVTKGRHGHRPQGKEQVPYVRHIHIVPLTSFFLRSGARTMCLYFLPAPLADVRVRDLGRWIRTAHTTHHSVKTGQPISSHGQPATNQPWDFAQNQDPCLLPFAGCAWRRLLSWTGSYRACPRQGGSSVLPLTWWTGEIASLWRLFKTSLGCPARHR